MDQLQLINVSSGRVRYVHVWSLCVLVHDGSTVCVSLCFSLSITFLSDCCACTCTVYTQIIHVIHNRSCTLFLWTFTHCYYWLSRCAKVFNVFLLQEIMTHSLTTISFASGGDGVSATYMYVMIYMYMYVMMYACVYIMFMYQKYKLVLLFQVTQDFIGYVAKDPVNNRGILTTCVHMYSEYLQTIHVQCTCTSYLITPTVPHIFYSMSRVLLPWWYLTTSAGHTGTSLRATLQDVPWLQSFSTPTAHHHLQITPTLSPPTFTRTPH